MVASMDIGYMDVGDRSQWPRVLERVRGHAASSQPVEVRNVLEMVRLKDRFACCPASADR
jgi:hypothetical protein